MIYILSSNVLENYMLYTLTEHFIRNTILKRPLLSKQPQFFGMTRCWKDSVPCRHYCIMQFLQICQLHAHSCCESVVLPHPKGVLLDSDLMTGKATEEHWTHYHVHETSSKRLLPCDMVHYHAGSSHEKMVYCGHEGMHMGSNNTQIGCGIQAMID